VVHTLKLTHINVSKHTLLTFNSLLTTNMKSSESFLTLPEMCRNMYLDRWIYLLCFYVCTYSHVVKLVNWFMSLHWIIWGRDTIPESSLQCSTCQKTYIGSQTHLDLTTTSGARNYGEPMPASTELFRHACSLSFLDIYIYIFFLPF
jgi:hypothetical protein